MVEQSADLHAAQRLVDAHECQMRGHDWEVILFMGSPWPQGIYCRRGCGAPMLRVLPPDPEEPHG